MMKVSAIRKQVRKVEGFDIEILDGEIKAPLKSGKNLDFSYDYKRAAPSGLTVSQWSRQRMPDDVKIKVYDSDGGEVHGRTTLSTVRQSYA